MSKLAKRLAGFCAASFLFASAANAALVVTVEQGGAGDSLTVFGMEGSLDLTGLNLGSGLQVEPGGVVVPQDGFFGWLSPEGGMGAFDVYTGDIEYPEVFGTGGLTETPAEGVRGDSFGISPIAGFALRVPANYVSGDELFGGMLFDATLQELGIEPGTYVWTLPSDTITLNVVIPVPAAVWLFASALGMLGWLRRKLD